MKHKFYNIRGKRYAKLGQLDAAIICYEKAISIKPKYVEAYYNLGFTHHKLGQLDEAIRSYKKVVAISPDYAITHNNKILSVIYFCFAGVGTYNKMNGNYQSIKPYEVSLCFLSLSSFKKV
jgi:tetratricopeptide (TPR) repeat protein